MPITFLVEMESMFCYQEFEKFTHYFNTLKSCPTTEEANQKLGTISLP